MQFTSNTACLQALREMTYQHAQGMPHQQTRQAFYTAAQQAAAQGIFLPFYYVVTVLSLSDAERFYFELLLGSAIDTAIAQAIAQQQADHTEDLQPRTAAQLYGDVCAILRLDAPLLQDCAYFIDEAGAAGHLRIDDRIVQFCLHGTWTDPQLQGIAILSLPEEIGQTPWCQREIVSRMQAQSTAPQGYAFIGADTAAQQDTAAAFAKERECPLLRVSAAAWAAAPDSGVRIVRECRLLGAVLCLTEIDALSQSERTALAALCTACSTAAEALILCAKTPFFGKFTPYPLIEVFFPLPDTQTRIALWQACGAQDAVALAERYCLSGQQIQAAYAQAQAAAYWQGRNAITDADLTAACRRQLGQTLQNPHIRVVPPLFTWEDLILPPRSKALLQIACDRIRNRHLVYDAWGFRERLPYGRGLSMLFVGPPGTGKTMGAQVVAGQLQLLLYQVDLAGVVSKYIGETEKNLDAVFAQAQQAQAILFFDEADVLFAKRTEIQDSHDKYSNMEAAYLLQKMENYDGIVILATNYVQNFDEAFKRRIPFLISFPFPDAAYRLQLWQRVFPPQVPLTEDIDWVFLAEQFEFSGSSIKNIAVNAAFFAAESGQPVQLRQILRALRIEAEKSGKTIRREDFGVYRTLWEEGAV